MCQKKTECEHSLSALSVCFLLDPSPIYLLFVNPNRFGNVSAFFDRRSARPMAEAQRQFELQLAGGPSFDFRLRRKDGSAIWVNISCRPMHDDSGVVVWLVGLFTDISERARMESTLRTVRKTPSTMKLK